MGKKLNNSIQKKLTRSFNLLILCALFITNCTLYLFLEQHYSEALISNYRTVKDNVSSQIESDLSSIESYARMVCVDNTLQDLVRSKASLSGYSHYRSLRDITSLLSKYIALKSDMIGDIYIMDAAGNPITPNGFYQDTAESGWYREFMERGVDSGFTSVHKEYQRGANLQLNQEKVISYIVGMYDQNGPAQKSSFLGYLIFNIKFDALTSRLGAYDKMHFILLDSGGAQIWGENDDRTDELFTLGNDNYGQRLGRNYYFASKIPQSGWKLILSVSVSTIYAQLAQVTALFIALVVLCLLVTWRLIIALARSTTEPLNTLAKGIQKFAAGDMETHIDVYSGDEVEKIAGVFNDMVDSIHKQMEENLRKEKEKRESQFRFLLAQIRPHFIYNCLNCIIYLARSGKNEDVITFTRSFIDILQASIKTQPLKEAPLTNEIEYLTKYILLIKYRYENTLEFTWDIDESCYGIRLPSLVLLPIVENSIFHGILPQKVLGHIFVTVTRQNGHIRTCIKDDGVGMTPGKLEQVRALLQKEDCESEEKNKHIGLANVNERLKLCFGNDSMLHIDSQEGTGTEVWFYIKE